MMTGKLQPSMAERLSELWAVLHRQASITLVDCEIHYLTSIALALDDDFLSHLLLKKLRLAKVVQPDGVPADIVRMNSYVEFTFGDEGTRFGQLLHPSSSPLPPYGLSIASLSGSGLIGLHAGKGIQWPGEDGKVHELAILRVANCPGLDRFLGLNTGDAAPADPPPREHALSFQGTTS